MLFKLDRACLGLALLGLAPGLRSAAGFLAADWSHEYSSMDSCPALREVQEVMGGCVVIMNSIFTFLQEPKAGEPKHRNHGKPWISLNIFFRISEYLAEPAAEPT